MLKEQEIIIFQTCLPQVHKILFKIQAGLSREDSGYSFTGLAGTPTTVQ